MGGVLGALRVVGPVAHLTAGAARRVPFGELHLGTALLDGELALRAPRVGGPHRDPAAFGVLARHVGAVLVEHCLRDFFAHLRVREVLLRRRVAGHDILLEAVQVEVQPRVVVVVVLASVGRGAQESRLVPRVSPAALLVPGFGVPVVRWPRLAVPGLAAGSVDSLRGDERMSAIAVGSAVCGEPLAMPLTEPGVVRLLRSCWVAASFAAGARSTLLLVDARVVLLESFDHRVERRVDAQRLHDQPLLGLRETRTLEQHVGLQGLWDREASVQLFHSLVPTLASRGVADHRLSALSSE